MRHAVGPVMHAVGPVRHAVGPVRHAVGPVRHAVGPLRHAVGPLGIRQAGDVGWRAQKLRQFLFWRVKSNLSGPSLVFVKKNGFCGH